MQSETRRVQFLVRMPHVPQDAAFVDGVYTETVVNVADLIWQQPAARTARVVADTGTIRSNRVVTKIVARAEVLPAPPARPNPGNKPEKGLPDAGAPSHSGLISTVGGLSVLLGGWLMLVSRRRGLLPQR